MDVSLISLSSFFCNLRVLQNVAWWLLICLLNLDGLIRAQRLLGQVVAIHGLSPGSATSTDSMIFANSTFAFIS